MADQNTGMVNHTVSERSTSPGVVYPYLSESIPVQVETSARSIQRPQNVSVFLDQHHVSILLLSRISQKAHEDQAQHPEWWSYRFLRPHHSRIRLFRQAALPDADPDCKLHELLDAGAHGDLKGVISWGSALIWVTIAKYTKQPLLCSIGSVLGVPMSPYYLSGIFV